MAEKQKPMSRAFQAGQTVAPVLRKNAARGLDATRGGVAAAFPMMAALPGLVRTAAPATTDFLRGVLGMSAAATPAARVAPARQAAAPGPSAAAPPSEVIQIMPQDRQLAMLDNVFQRPLTMRQMAAATGMMPASAKPQSDKDKVYGTASDTADALYRADLAAAAQAGSGKDEAIQKATDAYFKRQAALLGINTQQLTLQDMIDEED